jgi:hypothetical protein
MKEVVTKYPIKIGNVLIEKGEKGRVATLEEMKGIFPGISYNKKSTWLGIIFRDLKPCLVDKKQILPL